MENTHHLATAEKNDPTSSGVKDANSPATSATSAVLYTTVRVMVASGNGYHTSSPELFAEVGQMTGAEW